MRNLAIIMLSFAMVVVNIVFAAAPFVGLYYIAKWVFQ